MDYPDTTYVTYQYDGATRLTNIDHAFNAAPAHSAFDFLSLAYGLDNLGNIVGVREERPSANLTTTLTTNTYDELSRLIASTELIKGGSYHYNYDAAGNRTNISYTKGSNSNLTSFTYDAANRFITGTLSVIQTGQPNQKGLYSYRYSSGGDLLQEGLHTSNENGSNTQEQVTCYSYDGRNRLDGWDQNNATSCSSKPNTSFSYDGANTRTGMQQRGTATYQQYLQDVAGASGLSEVLQQTSNNSVADYLYAPGSTTPLFEYPEKSQSNGVGYAGDWVHSDLLGSVRYKTLYFADPAQRNNNRGYDGRLNDFSDGYGGDNTQLNSQKPGDNHLFAGEQLDPTGLYYNWARYYSPASGRFTQSDNVYGNPYDASSLNHYAYAGNNPQTNTDPNVHCPLCIIGGALALDHGFQVLSNLIGGKGWNSFSDINQWKLDLTAATAGVRTVAVEAGQAGLVAYGLETAFGSRATSIGLNGGRSLAIGLYSRAMSKLSEKNGVARILPMTLNDTCGLLSFFDLISKAGLNLVNAHKSKFEVKTQLIVR